MPKRFAHLSALVADPSAHMAALVAIMLRTLRIRTVDATLDIAQTARELDRHGYGLVLIDDQLAGPEGLDMIRRLRRSATHPNRRTPIFMMAAAPGVKLIADARDAGVDEFLRKPFSAEHIRLRLEAMRTHPRPFVEAEAYAGPDRRRRRARPPALRRAADRAAR